MKRGLRQFQSICQRWIKSTLLKNPVLRIILFLRELSARIKKEFVMTINSTDIGLPVEEIKSCILNLRGEKVMLDAHLAVLYGVATKVLIQAVKKNI